MKTIPVSLLVAGLLLPAVCLAEPEKGPDGPPPGEKGGRHGPPPGEKDERRGSPPGAFMELWKMADADRDGFLSKAEFNAMPRIQNLPEDKRENLFKRLDKDADGKLSREELGNFAKPRDGQGPRMQRLWELDTDKSGGISIEEFKAGELFKKLPPEKQDEVFKRLDTNGDGVISPSDRPEPPFKRPDGKRGPKPDGKGPDGEGGPPFPPVDGPGQISKKLDTNGDGALSFEEFRKGPAVKNLTEDQQEDRFELLDRNHDQKISPEDFPPPPTDTAPPAPAN
ncbi:MAG: EF-hand domain-containing protein [Luteolibacter sp.]|uniref:EF-hand domain-containing protein n=1 Tax=Luteolibacter sp. TaxID=1962973 RepID=UPI00326382A4